MMGNMSMTNEDLQVLYDLSIYNCTQFDTYTQIIYQDQQQQTREYTNVELAREAAGLSVGLHSLGIAQGDRVLVMMVNSPEVLITYQALARAGTIIIPVLPVLKAPEVHFIAANAGAKAIITNAPLLPLLLPTLGSLPEMRYVVATGMSDPSLKDEAGTLQIVSYNTVVENGADGADDYLTRLDGCTPSPEDTAVILYTSGTTGRPKGVRLSHRNLLQNALVAKGPEPELGTHEASLAVLPLAHAYGIMVALIAYLNGTQVVMLPRFEATSVLAAIERYHIISLSGVPAMFVALLLAPDADKYNTSSLQFCVSGSAPLPVSILQGFEQKFQCPIREGYGLSEATTVLTAHSSEIPVKPGSVGKPLLGIEVRVVDERDNPLPVGEVGEVIARGPSIMQGYYNLPEETTATLHDGWLHTGDMGRFDEDGYLYIVERKKDLIIRGGLNIYPRDVEEVLARHPMVIESAVVGVFSERMGEEVKAFVVTRGPVDEETLMAYCREHLANYKTPSQIEFMQALPRNAIGKINKKALRTIN